MVERQKTQALREFAALLRSDEEFTGTNSNNANLPGSGSIGELTDSPMQIVRLPMPESCDSSVRRTALARSGARLNRSRLASWPPHVCGTDAPKEAVHERLAWRWFTN